MSGSRLTGSPAELRTWLTERIAAHLGKEPSAIDATTTFEEQGLDSMAALTLCDDIEDELGLVVEPTLTWDHPTLGELTDFIAEAAAAKAGAAK
jgi:acyl carrier protein